MFEWTGLSGVELQQHGLHEICGLADLHLA